MSIIRYACLHEHIKRCITTNEYRELTEHMELTPVMKAIRHQHDIRQHFQPEPEANAGDKRKQPELWKEKNMMSPQNWADAEDFSTDQALHPHMNFLVMKTFKGIQHVGVITAASTCDAQTLRIIYHDGDMEDMTYAQAKRHITQCENYDTTNNPKPHIPIKEQMRNAEWYAKQWRDNQQPHIDITATKLTNQWADINYIATSGWTGPKPTWRDQAYALDRTHLGSWKLWVQQVNVHKHTGHITQAAGRRRIRLRQEVHILHPFTALQGTVHSEERARLDSKYKTPHPTSTAPPKHKTTTGTILDWATKRTDAKQTHATVPEYEPPVQVTYSSLVGQGRPNQISVSWNTQDTEIHMNKGRNTIGIAKNGILTIHSKRQEGKDIPDNGQFPAGERKKRLENGWHLEGTMDMRRATVIAAKSNTSLASTLDTIKQALQQPHTHRQPHWLLTTQPFTAYKHTILIGAHDTNPDPTFAHTTRNVQEAMLLKPDQTTAATLWLPKTDKDTTTDDLTTLQTTFRTTTVIAERNKTSPTGQWLEAHAHKAASIPRETPVIQHKLAHSNGTLTPIQSQWEIDIWIIGDKSAITTAHLAEPFWDDPYRKIPKLTGTLWDVYCKADQAAPYQSAEGTLAATDGSFKTQGGNLAGAGVNYRPSDNLEDSKERIQCDVSSLVPEIHAVRMALQAAPKDEKLTILTDSATVLWIATALTQTLTWRNLAKHGQIDAISRLVSDLDLRTAPTHLVKVASHRGCFMNEIADELAGNAANHEEEVMHTYDTTYDLDIPITTTPDDPKDIAEQTTDTLSNMLKTTIPQALMARRQRFLDTSPTRTYIALRDPTSGRGFLGTALRNMDTTATRRTVQIITHNFPSQARLKLWKKAPSALCPFCKKEAETTAHFSQACPQFSDARTKAHDTAWGAAWANIMKYKGPEWIGIHDTEMRKTGLLHDPSMALVRPDGILLNTITGEIIIFEFTRTSGYTAKDAQQAVDEKEKKYTKLTESVDQLNRGKYRLGATLCVIACTFTGALDESRIKIKLDKVLNHKHTTGAHKIMQALVQATLEAFNEMANICMAAKATLNAP